MVLVQVPGAVGLVVTVRVFPVNYLAVVLLQKVHS
jgi:hypothetical protein